MTAEASATQVIILSVSLLIVLSAVYIVLINIFNGGAPDIRPERFQRRFPK